MKVREWIRWNGHSEDWPGNDKISAVQFRDGSQRHDMPETRPHCWWNDDERDDDIVAYCVN